MLRSLPILLALCLTACTAHSNPYPDPPNIAESRAAPPRDFWLSITVTGPVRENAGAYETLPRALRPARYVVEADRVLRAALGPGAKDDSFPPPTRRLTAQEFTDLYHAVASAGLLDADHPFTVSTPPPAEIATGVVSATGAATTDDHTTFVISTHASEKQRTMAMEASPHGSEDSRRAARVIDWLANKAWIAPSTPAK